MDALLNAVQGKGFEYDIEAIEVRPDFEAEDYWPGACHFLCKVWNPATRRKIGIYYSVGSDIDAGERLRFEPVMENIFESLRPFEQSAFNFGEWIEYTGGCETDADEVRLWREFFELKMIRMSLVCLFGRETYYNILSDGEGD